MARKSRENCANKKSKTEEAAIKNIDPTERLHYLNTIDVGETAAETPSGPDGLGRLDTHRFWIPEQIQKGLDEGLSARIDLALNAIRQLPAEIHDAFEQHFDVEELREVELIMNALRTLQQRKWPPAIEMGALICPRQPLWDAAWGVRDTVEFMSENDQMVARVESEIFQPLEQAYIEVEGWDGIIRDWVESQVEVLCEAEASSFSATSQSFS